MEAPLSTLEALKELTEPVEPTIKYGQGHPQKYPTNKNPIMENYMTSAGISASSAGISVSSAGISARQSLHADISVLV